MGLELKCIKQETNSGSTTKLFRYHETMTIIVFVVIGYGAQQRRGVDDDDRLSISSDIECAAP